MENREVYRKIQEAVAAIEEYEKEVKQGRRGPWDDEIKKGMEIIIEKRHALAASGQICPRCGGSGRV